VILDEVGGAQQGSESVLDRVTTLGWRGQRTFAITLALIALLVPLHHLWVAQLILVPLLLVVPGLILLRALRIPADAVSAFPVYVPCASVIVMLGTGLAVDLIGLLAGAALLHVVPVLIGFEIGCFALLARCTAAPVEAALDWRSFSRPGRLAWPLVLPLVAAAGALRLNSGHGAGVALLAVIALVGLLVAGAVFSSRLDDFLLESFLYASGLAMLWSYSLRGDSVYGFDISIEYQKLEQTILAGVWHPGHPNDAYGAMLSVTVMPTELHVLSGVPALLIFKVIYPMVFALFPVAIFDLARRVLSHRWAYVGAAFTIGQYAFTEIASLARQEIALALFAALVAAMLDIRMARSRQWPLVALLGAAMALSHYSTTYVAVTVIGLMLPLQWATARIRGIPKFTGAVAVAFAATLVSAFIWYVPVTHSDSHLLQVAQTVQTQGFDVLPNRTPGGSLISAYLQGNTKTPIPAAQYQTKIHHYYQLNRSFIQPLANASHSQYTLRDSAVPKPPIRFEPGYDALSLGLLLLEQLANVLAAIGAVMMTLRRRASVMARQIGLLALVTTVLLTLLRFSGTLAVAYGQERAQLQALAVLAISMCWVGQSFEGMGVRRAQQTRLVVITTACLALVLVNTSYLAGAVLGGGTSVNLADSGAAFEYFDITTPELAAARWLGEAVRPGQLVYTDEYGQLPMVTVTGLQQGLFTDLTPQTINAHAWIYASQTNVVDGRAFAVYDNHLATYVFPTDYLSSYYDLVYTNGSSEVFHR
jgi:uncharacterized membrane protein